MNDLRVFLISMVFLLSSCSDWHTKQIDDNFRFGYSEGRMYTNLYVGDLPVIPGGCYAAAWNKEFAICKAKKYQFRFLHDFDLSKFTDNEDVYFVIIFKEYIKNPAQQNLSPGFLGPFNFSEIKKYEEEIKMNYYEEE